MASAGFVGLAALSATRLFGRRSEEPSQPSPAVHYEIEPIASRRLLVRRRSVALGSKVSVSAIHDKLDIAVGGIDAAFAELERIESVMSIYRPESQLSQLNRTGQLERADQSLLEVLSFAASISGASGGAFDVTVQPLWQLYANGERQQQLPSDAEIALAREQVDWTNVELSGESIRLRRSGAAVTLNGIAQGYAADRALAAMRAQGIEHALMDTGEIAPIGRGRTGNRWSVGIQHPRKAEAMIAVAQLDGRCLATSGDYATTFSTDRRFNHLFDPKTGKSPIGLMSVSVVAPTAMEADALSTACFVLGKERAKRLIESRERCDAFFVASDGSAAKTPGFPLKPGEVG